MHQEIQQNETTVEWEREREKRKTKVRTKNVKDEEPSTDNAFLDAFDRYTYVVSFSFLR